MKYSIYALLCAILISIVSHSQAQAQELPYRLDLRLDIPLAVGGATILGTSFILHKKNKAFTAEEVEAMTIPNINRLDRSSLKRWNTKAQKASDFFMYFSMATPGLLFTGSRVRDNWDKVLPIGAQTYLWGAGLTSFTKETALRTRPYVYNPDVPMKYKIHKDARKSFFSGHTSFSAFSTFFTAKTFADHYPGSKWRGAVWATSSIIPAVTGFLRYWGGKHYPTDILAGYVVGTLLGIFIPQLHQWVE